MNWTKLVRKVFPGFHWQELNDNPIKQYWFSRRCWIGRTYHTQLGIELTIPYWSSWGFSITINDGDSNDELHFSLLLGFAAFFVSIPFIRFPIGKEVPMRWDGDKTIFLSEEREFSINIHNGCLWICPFTNPMEWKKSNPWWDKIYCINPMRIIFGDDKFTYQILEEGNCFIPMLEGSYPAKYELNLECWKRPRWPFTRKIKRINFTIKEGIPHEGKGENSWDCGEDGMFGLCCPAETLEEGIGKVVADVLRSRKRHGGKHTHRDLGTVHILNNPIDK